MPHPRPEPADPPKDRSHDGRSLVGMGIFLLALAACTGLVTALRITFPTWPWHLFRGYRPRPEAWQAWTVTAGLVLLGAAMVRHGLRARRAHASRSPASPAEARPSPPERDER